MTAFAAWLEQVPWQLFGTFEFSWRVSDQQADHAFDGYINQLERDLRSPVTYIRAEEKVPASPGSLGIRRHYHALLAARVPLDPTPVAALWQRFGGNGHRGDSVEVRVYDPSGPAAEYCLKAINSNHGGWKARNMDFFIDATGQDVGRNSRQRRRELRNKARERQT